MHVLYIERILHFHSRKHDDLVEKKVASKKLFFVISK